MSQCAAKQADLLIRYHVLVVVKILRWAVAQSLNKAHLSIIT